MSAEAPITPEGSIFDGESANAEDSRQTGEDGDEVISAEREELLTKLAERSNGTKTPAVDSVAILNSMVKALKRQGYVDSDGRVRIARSSR